MPYNGLTRLLAPLPQVVSGTETTYSGVKLLTVDPLGGWPGAAPMRQVLPLLVLLHNTCAAHPRSTAAHLLPPLPHAVEAGILEESIPTQLLAHPNATSAKAIVKVQRTGQYCWSVFGSPGKSSGCQGGYDAA